MEKTLHTPPQRRRTQAERRDESERGLVKAAIAVVSEEGVSAATFEAIGQKGGYSRGLVGQRFGSKLGLIEAVIAYLHDEKETLATGPGIDSLPGLEALLTHVDLYLQRLSDLGELEAYFRLLAWAVADISAFRSAFAAAHDRVRERFEAWIMRGQAEGQHPAGSGSDGGGPDGGKPVPGSLDTDPDRSRDGRRSDPRHLSGHPPPGLLPRHGWRTKSAGSRGQAQAVACRKRRRILPFIDR